jgi:hypothetical protein
MTVLQLKGLLLEAAPKEVTDIFMYKHRGWNFFIAYKGIIYEHFYLSALNRLKTEEDINGFIKRFWGEQFIKYLEKTSEQK